MKLENKAVVVTGASSGMGRAISLLFAKEGAKVIAVARRQSRLEEIAKEAEGFPGEIIPFVGDVSKRETNEEMIQTAVSTFGKLDVLVNNAGIMDDFVPVSELTDELWDKVISVNLYGPMTAMRKAVQVMLEQETGGCIVNIASVGGLHGGRAGAAYSASKAAIINLSANTAIMYCDKKIRCNCICPGAVNSEIGSTIKNPSQLGYGRLAPGMALVPRAGETEEIAKTALFLASEDSSFINGTAIVADAGWTAY